MTRVGSPVHEPCPECNSYRIKIALLTPERIYYRCIACHYAWSEVERRKDRQSGRHIPERRRPRSDEGPEAESA